MPDFPHTLRTLEEGRLVRVVGRNAEQGSEVRS